MDTLSINVVDTSEVLAYFSPYLLAPRIESYRVTDNLFDDLIIYQPVGPGRTPWWVKPDFGKVKLDKIITAWKHGHNITNALLYAGVSLEQWETFHDTYPEIYHIKAACEAVTTLSAMETVQKGLKENPVLAYKYVEQRGDFNFTPNKVEEQKVLQPTTVNVAVGVNIDVISIQERARTDALAVLGRRKQIGSPSSQRRELEGVPQS